MAANTPVGNVTKMVQKLTTTIGDKVEVTYNNDILPFTTTDYAQVANNNRKFLTGTDVSPRLTSSSYNDTTLITSVSAVEQAAT